VIEEIVVDCPTCGEGIALDVDTTAGAEQSYVEDCSVCCRPMEVFVRCEPGRIMSFSVSSG
jgi:Cysteine-rich CPXCG